MEESDVERNHFLLQSNKIWVLFSFALLSCHKAPLKWVALRLHTPCSLDRQWPYITTSVVLVQLQVGQPVQPHTLVLHVWSFTVWHCWPSLLGLDPVEANFEGTPEEVRLDPSDADFVDVIHTDAAPLIPFLGEPHGVPVSSCGQDWWYFNSESSIQTLSLLLQIF